MTARPVRARRGAWALGLWGALAVAHVAWAAAPLPPGVDADRLHQLAADLRCLVCQNESLADSTAPLAQDLKREIAERMAAGDSDAQILDFLVARYGDFVTYRPPLAPRTLLLWGGPLGLLGAGGLLLWRQRRPGGPTSGPAGPVPHDPLADGS
ncbi:cytochrome c-type biogenesis protein [Ideonella livida]|uniref:Cytochrome c-type biogenesis protein n=1 Tax=Ideonella livida TaxID=2707176 RepID=A0A7C9TK92_9BURK|nr:cytochrome c-type biogenesis protein [Ideonella livida]NDY91483.1 cytochrome c-type biogenesis protein CcmH [Ideonella livida]